jgi:mannose-1-phosphate guanylyltransferase
MRAVVLVGGFGTRLRPLTDEIPKPMLPIGHRPMIARLVDRLAVAGVTEVTLALGFRPEPFLAAFPDGRCGDVDLVYAVEPEPLDTGGAIRFAADHAGIDDTFLVLNGDVVSDADLTALVAAHRRLGAEATLHLTPVEDPSAFGVVEVDEAGWVRRFVEKPAPGETDSRLINAGTYVFEPSVLERIPTGQRVSIERATFPAMVADGTLAAVATDDYWLDTGLPESYRRANLDLLQPGRPVTCEPVAPGARVAADAVVLGSIVDRGAVVGAGARVLDSVLLAGAQVGAGAVVERSIVMGVVGAGARLCDAVVGAAGEVPAGDEVVGRRVPEPV